MGLIKDFRVDQKGKRGINFSVWTNDKTGQPYLKWEFFYHDKKTDSYKPKKLLFYDEIKPAIAELKQAVDLMFHLEQQRQDYRRKKQREERLAQNQAYNPKHQDSDEDFDLPELHDPPPSDDL